MADYTDPYRYTPTNPELLYPDLDRNMNATIAKIFTEVTAQEPKGVKDLPEMIMGGLVQVNGRLHGLALSGLEEKDPNAVFDSNDIKLGCDVNVKRVSIQSGKGENTVIIREYKDAVTLGEFVNAWGDAPKAFRPGAPLLIPPRNKNHGKMVLDITVRVASNVCDDDYAKTYAQAKPMRLLIEIDPSEPMACCFIEEKDDAMIMKPTKAVITSTGNGCGEVFMGSNSPDVSIVVPSHSPKKRSMAGGNSVGSPPPVRIRTPPKTGPALGAEDSFAVMLSDISSLINDFSSTASLRGVSALVEKYGGSKETAGSFVRAITTAFNDASIIKSV